MVSRNFYILNTVLAMSCLFVGCSQGDNEFRELGDNDNVTNTAPPEHHDHGAGPHGGHVLEFGDYHGEITFEEGVISVYVLGQSDLNAAAPVADANAVVKLKVGEDVQDVELTASPLEGETDGMSSKFVSSEGAVPESVKDIEDIHGSVELTVGKKILTAEVAHDHDHHDH